MVTTEPIPAAQYLRMSSELQRYSLEAQAEAIAEHARRNGYRVVRTYADDGASGLRLAGRTGLGALLSDALAGCPAYRAILVYDVSRWGRFQDPDEGAHYEFLCRRAGYMVEYCAEPFANDGSVMSSVVKNLKRIMAAEYSRELSAKVRRAHHGLSEQGYWQGGDPPYGLRRRAVGPTGPRGPILNLGEPHAVQGDRVVLVRGPDHEVAVVRRIFRERAAGLTTRAIAAGLNRDGAPAPRSAAWHAGTVGKMFANEAYIGVYVSGRKLCLLGRSRSQPPAAWRRIKGAFEPIVSRALFRRAQGRRRKYHARGATQTELRDELRQLLRRKGYLSTRLLNDDRDTHCAWVYVQRFGCLANAYRDVGFEPGRLDAAEQARRGYQKRARLPPEETRRRAREGARRAAQEKRGRASEPDSDP